MGAVATRPAEAVARLRALAGDRVAPLGVAALPTGPVLLRQPPAAAFDWVVLPLEDDPLYRAGQLAIPRAQRRHLARLDRDGVTFDELLIGHEVPKALTAKLAAGGPVKPEEVIVPTPSRSAEAALAALDTGVRAGGLALAAVALAPLALLALPAALVADPVLLGAITADGTRKAGTPAALFLLARW